MTQIENLPLAEEFQPRLQVTAGITPTALSNLEAAGRGPEDIKFYGEGIRDTLFMMHDEACEYDREYSEGNIVEFVAVDASEIATHVVRRDMFRSSPSGLAISVERSSQLAHGLAIVAICDGPDFIYPNSHIHRFATHEMQHLHDFMYLPDHFMEDDQSARHRAARNRRLIYGATLSTYVTGLTVAFSHKFGVAANYPELELASGELLSLLAWNIGKKLVIDGEIAQAAYTKSLMEERARVAESKANEYPVMLEVK